MSIVREIELGHGRVALVDADDFGWASKYSWHFKEHGGCGGYARSTVRVGEHTVHHVLHRLVIRARPHEVVDHVNRDRLDNRKTNLRFCTLGQNMVNRKNTNKTGFRGVFPRHGKFHAVARLHGVQRNGPSRPSAEEAALDYDAFAKELHGEFAILNFPEAGEAGHKYISASPAMTSEGAF